MILIAPQDLEKVYEYMYKYNTLKLAEEEQVLPDNAYNLKAKIEQQLNAMLNKMLNSMAGGYRYWIELHEQDAMATVSKRLSDKDRKKYANYQRSLIKRNKNEFLKEFVYSKAGTFSSWFWGDILAAMFTQNKRLADKMLGADFVRTDPRYDYDIENYYGKKYGWYTWNDKVFGDPEVKAVLYKNFDTLIDSLTDPEIFNIMNFKGTSNKIFKRHEKYLLHNDPDGRSRTYINIHSVLNDLAHSTSKPLPEKINTFNTGLTTAHNNGDMATYFIEGGDEMDTTEFLDHLSNQDVSKWDQELRRVLWRNPREIDTKDPYFQPESLLLKATKLLGA